MAAKFIIIVSLVASAVFAGTLIFGEADLFLSDQRINGLNLEATKNSLTEEELRDISQVNPNWLSVVPYAYSRKEEPRVHYNFRRQWYGETTEGIARSITEAKAVGYRVMIKPHVWVIGDGWPGDYDITEEADWETWEDDYEKYILTYAKMADSLQADMLCIGTEYRHAVRKRPEFWRSLIRKVRQEYNGMLSYAANWDNYEKVTFWDELDYVGIDAYFPLNKEKRSSVEQLTSDWEQVKEKLRLFSERWQKPILFTEYGYQSIEYATMGHWEEKEHPTFDMVAQKNAYEALYRTFWQEPWFAGGFLWKWHPDHENAGGINNTKFTPQNKHAQEVVARWYDR